MNRLKRIIAALSVLLLISGALFACKKEEQPAGNSEAVSNETETGTEDPGEDLAGRFTVGFARQEVMPANLVDEPVILSNYGVDRLSTGFYNELYVSCTAVTDPDGTTLLLFVLDMAPFSQNIYQGIATEIQNRFGVDPEYIHFNNTHNHAAVNVNRPQWAANVKYANQTQEACYITAEAALKDRKEATIQVGSSETEGLNFVRHYQRADGSYKGDNYDTTGEPANGGTNPLVSHTHEADGSIQLLRFVREDAKDVLFVGWRAHNHLGAGSARTILQGGFPVSMVQNLEENDDDLYAVFLQGDAGNINPSSSITAENKYFNAETGLHDVNGYGAELADCVRKGLEKMEPAETGAIRVYRYEYTGKIRTYDPSLKELAQPVYTRWKSGTITPSEGAQLCREANQAAGLSYVDGIHSVYHCVSIVEDTPHDTGFIHLWAYSIGPDVGMTLAEYEMFDTNGGYIRENSPFKMTLTVGYCNTLPGDETGYGYIPNEAGWEHGCYEVDKTRFVKGTAEELATIYVDMLKALKEETTKTVLNGSNK